MDLNKLNFVKLGYCSLVFVSILITPFLPKILLDSKVVIRDSKMIISLCSSKSVTLYYRIDPNISLYRVFLYRGSTLKINSHVLQTKAMRKDFISAFSCFTSFVLCFIPYIFSIYGILRHNRFAKISRNIHKRNCETRYTRKTTEMSKNRHFQP